MNKAQLKQLIRESLSEMGSGGLDKSKITNIKFAGINPKDAPDYVNAYIKSADYIVSSNPLETRELTSDELEMLNNPVTDADQEFFWDALNKQLHESKRMTKSELKQLIREALVEVSLDNDLSYEADWAKVLVDEVKKIFGNSYQGYNFLDKSNRVIKIYTKFTQPITVTQTSDKSMLPDKVFAVKEGNGKVSKQRGWSNLFKYLKSMVDEHPDSKLGKWLDKRLTTNTRPSDYDIYPELQKLRSTLPEDSSMEKSKLDDVEYIESLLNKLRSGELVKDDILRKQLIDILIAHRDKIK